METERKTAPTPAQQKKRTKRIINLIAIALIVAALAVGGVFLYQYLTRAQAGETVVNYSAQAVREGEIASVVSGSGTLSAVNASSITAPADATVLTVEKQSGDEVKKGETVMTLTSDAVEDELDALYDELDDVQSDLAATTQYRTSLTVTATKSGVVKGICVAAGELADNLDYLCLISTDGRMKLTIDAPDGLKKYDAVTAEVAGETVAGYVTELIDGTATIVIEKNTFDLGATAVVYNTAGQKLGEGALDVNEHVRITAAAGQIDVVSVSENQNVSKGRTLFKLKKGAPTDDYAELKAEEEDLLESIRELEDELTIKAEWDAVLSTLSVKKGDEVAAGDALCVFSGTDGYQMSLAIDELDISSIQHGQDAVITLDALDGEFSGKVTNISYAGSGSYVTSYTVTITTDPIEGAYPGMSASAEITTSTSGKAMIVSVAAVQYDGDQAYVYLAGDGVAAGTTSAESALNLDELQKLDVTTGMSDGSYIAVTADGLSAGDVVWAMNRTTSAVYTEDENATTTFSGMGGGMPGGDFGGGMPSGNFGGGMPGGNMGGGMGGGSTGGGQRRGN